ncbi:MAG: AAA family ATPase [Propioniciclava sp.]
MHAAVVAVSELYNAALADRLTRTLGLGWEARDRGRDRNPSWEIEGVPDELVAEFSTRSRHIDVEKERLIAKDGRPPSARMILKLRAQATLATRPEKQVRSLADLTRDWRGRASRLLGADATAWARALIRGASRRRVLRADDVPLDVVHEVGQAVMNTVAEKRATWTRWNLYAEASRQLMGWRFASLQDREAIAGLIVDAAERVSLRLTPPELASSPLQFRRADGTSRFRPHASVLFSSESLLAAEDRLLDRAADVTGSVVPLETIERVARKPDPHGRVLGEDQAAALAAIAGSGRVVDILVGPAGAGKTTAMNALRRAWVEEHGPGSVVGLATSAVAARVLAEDLGIEMENTAKWRQNHIMSGTTFTAGQLVVVDEASLAGTMSLDRITHEAEKAGVKVLLVGDWAQLQSVDVGGAFALLVHARDDAPELIELHRFTHAWEKTTSLQLRHGHTEAMTS